jgi:hypothetical protein
MRGKVMESTAAQNKQVDTAQAIPTSVTVVSLVDPIQEHGCFTSVGQREDLGGIRVRYWTLTGRVKCCEEEDEEGDEAKVCGILHRNIETHSSG